MYHLLYEHIAKACCAIRVLEDDEEISTGSGFAFMDNGHIITAAHVVHGDFPVNLAKYANRPTKILVKLPGFPEFECTATVPLIEIHVVQFNTPLQLDFAILVPNSELPFKVPFLFPKVIPPRVGQEVFMAGYSEELVVPFNIDKLLSVGASVDLGHKSELTGSLIKRGVIGNIRGIKASDNSGRSIECSVFFVDNAMHRGSSGGPIVDDHGDVIGINTKRAVVSASQSEAPNLEVPSGCTIGITLDLLRWYT